MTYKNCFAIRTHLFGEREKNLYQVAEKFFGKQNTYFILNVDEDKLNIPPSYNAIYFNKSKILSDKELFWPHDCAWRCGDYCYYVLDHELSGYDYYWLTEPDIQICNPNPSEFFDQINSLNHDFLTVGYGKASPNSFFYHTARLLSETPMACIFPFTRLKADKIKTFYEVRKKFSIDFINNRKSEKNFLNDESFISTMVNKLNYSCGSLEKITSFNFKLFTANNDEAFLEEDVRGIKGNFILHPILEQSAFIDKKIKRLEYMLNQKQNVTSWMEDILIKINDAKTKRILKDHFKDVIIRKIDES